MNSTIGLESGIFRELSRDLHGGFPMRRRFNPQPRLDCPLIEQVKLNLNCRDEIIPILRALQHIYSDSKLRREILDLVGEDVNRETSNEHGRPGMAYWQIAVLAAVRLGCNLDYDKLQDLAEQHRNLRFLMGIGDWQEQVDFDWRRIHDNLCHLRPETLKKINRLVVTAGHKLAPARAYSEERWQAGAENWPGVTCQRPGRSGATEETLPRAAGLGEGVVAA